MRHLMGMILAVGLAAAVFFAGSWGYTRLAARAAAVSRVPGGGPALLSDHHALAALIAVAGTGLLAGILVAAPRISPLAAGLPGLILVAWTALYVISAHRAASLIPLRSHAFGTGFQAMLASGILAAAGLAMISPLFVPSRWSRGHATGSGGAEDGEIVPGMAGPADELELADEREPDGEPGLTGEVLRPYAPRAADPRPPAMYHGRTPPSPRTPGITY